MKKILVFLLILLIIPTVMATHDAGRPLAGGFGGYYGGYKNMCQQVVKDGYPYDLGRLSGERTLCLDVGSKILFDVGGGDYNLEVLEVSSEEEGAVKYQISPRIGVTELQSGFGEKYDLDLNGFSDLFISLEGILPGKNYADLTLSIYEEPFEKIVIDEGDEGEAVPTEYVGTEPEETLDLTYTPFSKLSFFLVGLVSIILIALCVALIIKIKKKNANIKK